MSQRCPVKSVYGQIVGTGCLPRARRYWRHQDERAETSVLSVPSASVSASELCRLPAGAQLPKAWASRGHPSSYPHTPALGTARKPPSRMLDLYCPDKVRAGLSCGFSREGILYMLLTQNLNRNGHVQSPVILLGEIGSDKQGKSSSAEAEHDNLSNNGLWETACFLRFKIVTEFLPSSHFLKRGNRQEPRVCKCCLVHSSHSKL